VAFQPHRNPSEPRIYQAVVIEIKGQHPQVHVIPISTDLKYALRECIELIANEAIWYKRTVAKEKVFERNDTDLADQLSRESLRYMYRLLFMFYIEARPELGYAPIDAEAYLKGYSIEHLRELEQTPLTTSEAQEGFYFHDSLKQLFGLIWQGYPRRDATSSQLDLSGSHDGLLDNGFTPTFTPNAEMKKPNLSQARLTH
jgi:hypothetical protein